MSHAVEGGIDYALTKRHYDADDYVSHPDMVNIYTGTALNGVPFTLAAETFYISGLMAYLNDPPTILSWMAPPVPFEHGWCPFTHGQATAPAWLAPLLTAAGVNWLNLIPGYPNTVPAFEAKDILFYATEDCWVWFEGSSRVRHYIPANTYVRFHRRCFMFWVISDTAALGELRCWIEG